MQAVVVLRTNRSTNWAAAAWKPEGPGEFGPISSPSVLIVTPLRPAPAGLILDQIRYGRMIPI